MIFGRRSIRVYAPGNVTDEAIDTILKAAMSAPSAVAKDPWRFVVVRDQAVRDRIVENLPHGKMLAQAPVGIIVCGDINAAHDNQLSYLLQDCSAAIENLLLAVHALGLGACWLGVHPREDRIEHIQKVLGMPDNIIPIAAISIGHPGETKEPRTRYNPAFIHTRPVVIPAWTIRFKPFETLCRRTLQSQRFSDAQPGSILGDIRTMLDFIGPSGRKSSSKLGNLPSTILPELNLLLSRPVQTGLKRALMRDYPNVTGLFILLRVMQLTCLENGRLRVNTRIRSQWENLNPLEQYFALIEAWLLMADPGIVSDKTNDWTTSQILLNLSFLARAKPPDWSREAVVFSNVAPALQPPQLWNVELAKRFGLVETRFQPPAPDRAAPRIECDSSSTNPLGQRVPLVDV